MKLPSVTAGLSGLLLAACAAIPPPPVPPAPSVHGQSFTPYGETSDVTIEWWTAFDDPVLEKLVLSALALSPALRQTDFTVSGAEAALRLALLGTTASVSSRAAAEVSRPSGAVSAEAEVSGSAGLSASWEMDAYGRLEALVEAARSDVRASRELRRDMAVTISSATALAYTDLRGAEARLSVAERNAAIQAEGLALVRTLFANGRATQLDIERAETLYRTTLSTIPVYRAQRQASANQLASLTGLPATQQNAIEGMLAGGEGKVPALRQAFSAGTPQELVRRRPDIRIAEARVASALALGEAARADLFPEISFNADLTALLREGRPMGDNTLGFGFGPAIRWAGPDLRRVYAQIDARDARTGEVLADYERTVLNALSEVQTALSDLDLEQLRTGDLEAALVSAGRSLQLARLRYEEGLDSYLNVLDAQRSLLDVEDRLALNRVETARRAIRAYRSLGGIWTDEELAAFRAGQE